MDSQKTEKYVGSNVSNDPRPVEPPKEERPRVAIVPHSFSSIEEYNGFDAKVTRAFQEGLLPESIKTAKQAVVVALKGRELGLDPLYALSVISLIKGKAALSSEAMLALVYKHYPRARLEFVTSSEKRNEECVLEVTREGGKPQIFCFTLEDAKRAGLTGKENWQKYPAAMLRARVIGAAVRAVFPECIMGLPVIEEVQDLLSTDASKVDEVDAKFS